MGYGAGLWWPFGLPWNAGELESRGMMKPSDTTLGKQWLAEFESVDQQTAQLLIDSLEIHDHVEIMNTLADRLRKFALKDSRSTPVLLVPVRSIEDLSATGSLVDGEHVAYESFNPGATYPVMPGSEAEIGSMFRSLVDEGGGLFVSPDTSIDEMKRLKVRTICLVVDYSGSGTQVARFVETFRANRTIASWISYGYLNLRVVTYAANVAASRRLNDVRNLGFEAARVAKSATSADWSQEQRKEIEALCNKYAIEDDQNSALGYRDSFGLYLSNMRVPNNLPQILIRSGGPFPGLFAGRRVASGFVHELRSYRPAPSLGRTLRNLGQPELASRLEEETRPVQALRALAALQLLDFGLTETQVWAMLDLDEQTIVDLRTTLIALGCITLDNNVTKRGRTELQRARYLGVSSTRYLHHPRNPVKYVPTQLR
jgi:hypothetical protein